MKQTSKGNAGFTLVELVVALAIATVVTAAATSVLFMGLNINRQTGDTASQQMTVRQLLNVVQDAAADGRITNVKSAYDAWELVEEVQLGGENAPQQRVIFSYNAETQTIYTNGVPVLTGVYASEAIIEDNLLTISVETKEGIFASSVYCRMAIQGEGPQVDQPEIKDEVSVENFIAILKSQYRSRGEIRKDGKDTGEYYSEWYSEYDYDDAVYDNGWNYKTPWCACFVSWALDQAGMTSPVGDHPRWFANVDDFMDYFQKNSYDDYGQSWLAGGEKPTAGDLIFFDWNKGTNPQHVGVVLSVSEDGKYVYTIEGNSAGRVTVRSYPIGDSRIIGYGVLWPK